MWQAQWQPKMYQRRQQLADVGAIQKLKKSSTEVVKSDVVRQTVGVDRPGDGPTKVQSRRSGLSDLCRRGERNVKFADDGTLILPLTEEVYKLCSFFIVLAAELCQILARHFGLYKIQPKHFLAKINLKQ